MLSFLHSLLSFQRIRFSHGQLSVQLMFYLLRLWVTGFLETKTGCCGTGYVEAGPLCNELTQTCPNSSQHLFWDSIHPCESAYYYISLFIEEQVLPQLFFGGSTNEY